MKRILTNTVLLVALSTSLPAFSDQINFMTNSPVRYYNNTDWKLSNANTQEALQNTPDGKTITWQNPKTKSHGSATPFNTTTKNGLTCRNLKIVNYAAERSDQYTFKFCNYPNLGWKIPGDKDSSS